MRLPAIALVLLFLGCSEAHTRPECYRPAPDAGASPGDGGEWSNVPAFDLEHPCRDWRARR